MKKSIRIIGGMLAVTTTLLTLASCKASPSGKDDDDTFGGNGGKTVVRYYSFNDEQSNKELKAAIEADFYKKNPDIKIQLEISTGNFYSNLLNDVSGKNEADVFAPAVSRSAGRLASLSSAWAVSSWSWLSWLTTSLTPSLPSIELTVSIGTPLERQTEVANE